MVSPARTLRSSTYPTSRHPRRKRHDSDETVTLKQQPQRKKSKLNNGSVSTDSDGLVNGNIEREEEQSNSQALDLAYRPGRVADAHSDGKDSGKLLTQSARYTIRQLSSLPDQFRHIDEDIGSVYIGPQSRALAITRKQAFVWDYQSHIPSPSVHIFNLLDPAKPKDPLPVGALVTSGTGSEIGLVIINAVNGRISFCENVDNAEALELFEKNRNVTEGNCGKMLASEHVTGIEDAGAAGFVLLFSTGRSAQLRVRDAQSRPAISVNILRAGGGPNGGIFDGLKSVFGVKSFLKPTAAVRRRPLALRESSEIIIGSKEAIFHYWRIRWAGEPNEVKQVDARATVEGALFPSSGPNTRPGVLEVIDFAIASDTREESDLLLLVSFRSSGEAQYALVEVDVDAQSATARRAIVLTSYSLPTVAQSTWNPRICLSQLGDTAFVIFENAITIVSLATPSPSAASQILMDVGQLLEPFQDTVFFVDGDSNTSCGANVEISPANAQMSSAVVFVKDFGMIRVEAPTSTAQSASGLNSSKLSAKSKIEQAVFFGSIPSNPLDLTRAVQQEFSTAEIEGAALAISSEILSSASPFIIPVAASMANHLEKRAQYLAHLATYVFNMTSDISRSTRWRLRFDGEKLASARTVWDLYDTLMRYRWKSMHILPACLRMMDEAEKTDLGLGEYDRARVWCTKDVASMSTLFGWILHSLERLQMDGMIRSEGKYLELASEAHDIVNQGYGSAYEFRSQSARLYRLETEPMQNQLLVRDYRGLGEFWTSSSLRTLFEIKDHLLRMHTALVLMQNDNMEPDDDMISAELLQKLYVDCAALTDTFCRSSEECIFALLGEEEMETKDSIELYYGRNRTVLITRLLELSHNHLSADASNLAEKWSDMEALVTITTEEAARLSTATHKTKQDQLAEAALATRIAQYFQLFGASWSNAMFSRQLRGNRASMALNFYATQKADLTRYLRAEASRAKLSWINDIMSEREYMPAAESLTLIAREQETGLWSQKAEMSIAKLALLSMDKGQGMTEPAKRTLGVDRDGLELIRIQERLRSHIRIKDAVDEIAEAELVRKEFGARVMQQTPALDQLLENGLEKVMKNEALAAEQLIDVLSLMSRPKNPVHCPDLSGAVTYLALLALKHSGLQQHGNRFEVILKQIWRRCYINEDWQLINRTDQMADYQVIAALQATALFQAVSQGHKAGLWDGSSGIRVVPAGECLGNGTTAEEYSTRFHDESFANRVAHDSRREDELLQGLVDTCKLEHWISVIKELADGSLGELQAQKERLVEEVERITSEEGDKVMIGSKAAYHELARNMC